jgi:hypothetical protein
MPNKLSDEKKLYICEMLEKGCTYRQIGQDLGVSPSTVSAVKKEFYGKDDAVKKSIVAGDKFNGLLECVGSNQYVGSCRVHGGKFKKRRFNCSNSAEAKKQWEEWKNELHAEEKPVNNTPIEVKPMRKPINVNEKTVITAPAIAGVVPVEANNANEIYILAVGDPKIAGSFATYDEAEQAAIIANNALEFAGVDIRYKVLRVLPYGTKS